MTIKSQKENLKSILVIKINYKETFIIDQYLLRKIGTVIHINRNTVKRGTVSSVPKKQITLLQKNKFEKKKEKRMREFDSKTSIFIQIECY